MPDAAPAHQGLKDLLTSERGTFCLLLVIAATALVLAGRLDTASWLTFMRWLAMLLVASKTVTGSVQTWAGVGSESATPVPGA